MKPIHSTATLVLSCLVIAFTGACAVQAPKQDERPLLTWRIEYRHRLAPDKTSEDFVLDRVVEEGPWCGPDPRHFAEDDLGLYRCELVEKGTGRVFFAAGFCSVFGEWRTTDDAKAHPERAFEESLRVPSPTAPCDVRILKRDAMNRFAPIFTGELPGPIETAKDCDPNDLRELGPISDPRTQVDLLFLGDGYTEADRAKFFADATRLSESLLSREPYRAQRLKFNVRALFTPGAVPGIANPDAKVEHDSALGCRFSTFGLPRYVLTLEDRKWRAATGRVPYDAVIMLVNSRDYGGGGIFNTYCIATADNPASPYLVAHEFGHSFSGLGDEYYTSPVAYRDFASKTVEPWEPNITALLDPAALKWKDAVAAGTDLPTPWAKAEFDTLSKTIEALKSSLDAEVAAGRKTSSEAAAIVEDSRRAAMRRIFDSPERIGAYEGALYESHGLYRPAVDCIMFRRDCDRYCQVCSRSVARRIANLTS